MSKTDFEAAKKLKQEHPTLATLIMTAMDTADPTNSANLRQMFPTIYTEWKERLHSEDGLTELERQGLERKPVEGSGGLGKPVEGSGMTGNVGGGSGTLGKGMEGNGTTGNDGEGKAKDEKPKAQPQKKPAPAKKKKAAKKKNGKS